MPVVVMGVMVCVRYVPVVSMKNIDASAAAATGGICCANCGGKWVAISVVGGTIS